MENKLETNIAEQTRSVKELLELMLQYRSFFESGLCKWILNLLWYNYITREEYKNVIDYIKKNRPSMFSSIESFKRRKNRYYWLRGKIEPRIEWINKQIKKLSK